jgi:hypothetical protein
MRKILIFSDGGLGNRLNSLIGGLLTSPLIGTQPEICWPINNWCRCHFDDLFSTELSVTSHSINEIFLDEQKIYLIHENQLGKVFTNTYPHSLDSIEKIKNLTQDIVYFHNSTEKILLSLSNFKINEKILETVNYFCENNNITKQVKGIHLRKTDHGRQLDSDAIWLQCKNDLHTRYFVCSDDKLTEEKFKQLPNITIFPKEFYVEKLVEGSWNDKIKDTDGRIFAYNVNRSKNSVIEAFIDLLILSRTTIVIKNKSSFLGWAKIYSNLKTLE